MNRNKKVAISIPIIIIGVIVFFYRIELLAMAGLKPEIVEDYVCSDFCYESDFKKIYKDITDETYCKKIGGKPYTYYGWGESTVCLAE